MVQIKINYYFLQKFVSLFTATHFLNHIYFEIAYSFQLSYHDKKEYEQF